MIIISISIEINRFLIYLSFLLVCSNPITGESAMDRLACALGGKTMLPHILTNVNNMLGHGK
jgi:hypothetical protein